MVKISTMGHGLGLIFVMLFVGAFMYSCGRSAGERGVCDSLGGCQKYKCYNESLSGPYGDAGEKELFELRYEVCINNLSVEKTVKG